MSLELSMTVAIVSLIIFGIVVPVLCAVDLWAGEMIGALVGTVIDIALCSSVDVSTGVDGNMRAVTKTALDFVPMLA